MGFLPYTTAEYRSLKIISFLQGKWPTLMVHASFPWAGKAAEPPAHHSHTGRLDPSF